MIPIHRPFSVESLESRQLFSVPTDFTQELIAGQFASPTAMAVAPDGRVFVAEQGGTIRIVKDGQRLSTPFATLNVLNEAECGLIGLTLDPNFAQNGHVYVYYTTSTPVVHNRVSRLTAATPTSDVVAANSEVHLLDQAGIGMRRYHNGGAMKFGPDGKLYIGVGDSAEFTVAQELTNTKGKILRINPDGSIPADNPFYAQTTGVNQAIWALGLRNPFSIAFQPGTGRFYINDVGHNGDNAYEEVNLGAAGANYGWPGIEGPRTAGEVAPANYRDPFYSYVHGPGGVNGYAITGGVFYNPAASATHPFPAQYHGDYFFLDLDKYVKTLEPDGSTVGNFATGFQGGVGLDLAPDGSLLYLQRGNQGAGPAGVFRIRYTGDQAPTILTQPTDQRVTVGEAATFAVTATGTGTLGYQWLRNGSEIPGATQSTYTLANPTLADSGATFSVRVSSGGGLAVTSAAANLLVETNRAPVPMIDLPTTGTLFVAGQSVAFSGSASDPDEGALAAASLSWSVSYFTGSVERPAVPPTGGQASGSFVPATTTPYLATDVKYRIYLTATDAAGRQTTVFRDVAPTVGTIRLASNVAGIGLTLDGQPRTAPSADATVAGLQRQIAAPATQTVGGVTYDFAGWSDGGAATHTITAPTGDATYTATYTARPAATIRRFNFQPGGAATVSGYVVDGGQTYGARNGYTYGWTTNHTDAVVDRNVNANQLLDTNVGVKAASKWELALPNGTYTVTVGVGDAAASSRNNVWIEGTQNILAYVTLPANQFRTASTTVTVTDGRLTLGVGGASTGQTRINYLEVTGGPTSPPPTSPPPTSPPPTSPPPTSPPPTSPPTSVRKVNFQPAGAPAVSGYLVDAGQTYAARNGFTYGWTTSHTDAVLDRNVNANQLLDTRVAVKSAARWEMAVANGRYTVTVASGDAAAASTANVWVEGAQLYNYVNLPANQFRTNSLTVTVTDGRLTVGIGSAAGGTVRLNYLELQPA